MQTQYFKRILEDGEIKTPIADFDNFKGNDIVDFDYRKYQIIKLEGNSEWLDLFYYDDLTVAYKYELVIELQKMQLEYLTNDIFAIQDLIIKYTPIIQNAKLNDDFEFLSKLMVQELEYQAKKRNYQ